ncbi:uncharacterized protein PV07_09761 [Cladophialophora immunda]|uniref:Uncharacterized protein n=1 Tax=Cladophialophora immunda TaxID=569365 RepID=A0A0D2AGR3_9EURO|nr:uncharacterized protein PV07_09761 [Cladophialophora immunda]KIW24022.1 hypothetical protein PV07_09761 [Cladophialophora immunda]OQV01844.1 hypothetical protein CLAIMM_07135 [Cladophialophora immunda]
MPGTWFLPPDFTFTTDGPLRLGMVIPHWFKPTTVLAAVGSGTASDIKLPTTKTIVEPNHIHSRSESRSTSQSLWFKFEGTASASASADIGKSNSIDYSETDHEIQSFSDPLMPETVTAIANLPAVRAQIDSGMFGKRAVYIVSGLRIATSSFTVAKGNSSNFTVTAEGSGPPTATVPIEIGGEVKHDGQKKVTDSYDTAPGIVFAYRLNVIRTRRAGVETELFSHKSAFLTGAGDKREEPLVLVEATKDEIDEDLEEEVEYESVEIGEDELCIYLPSKK